MIFLDIAEFASKMPRYGVVAGLDLGTKTIGVALSDLRRTIASPSEVISRTRFTQDAAKLLDLLRKNDACGVILGLPLNMDASEGPRAQSTRAFARNIAALTPIPIAFWDERLSTVAAERALLEADTSRKRRKEVIDQVAAGYILQGALDRLTHMQAKSDE